MGTRPRNVPIEQAFKEMVEIVSVTFALPPPPTPIAVHSSTLALVVQPFPSIVPSRLAPTERSSNLEAPIANILRDATFQDWRVI